MAENVIEFSLEAIDNFSKAFGLFGKTLGSLASAWAATGGAVVAFTNQVANQIDKINDLSKRYGVAVEALSEFDHIARLSGTSIDQVAIGIQFLQRNMSEANRGVGAAVKVFDSLGFSVEGVSGRTKEASSAMYEIADRIAAIQDPAKQTELAIQIFGRSGAQLLPILREGSEGMRAMAADAEFLGVKLSSQAAANAAEFKDQMDRVGQAIRGASFAVAGEWIPVLTGMAKAVANFIAESIPEIKEFANKFMRFMIGAFVVVEMIATNVWGGLKKLFTAEGFDKFLSAIVEGAKQTFLFVVETAGKAGPAIVNILISAGKIAWTAFYELAKWAWMKVFDFISGQNLAPTLGQVLFERIPEEAAKHVEAFKSSVGEYGNIVLDTLGAAGDAVGGVFGLSLEGINQRIDEIIEKFTVLGETVAETTKGTIEPTLLEMYQQLEAQKQQRLDQIEAEIYFAETFSELWTLTFEALGAKVLTWNQLTSQIISQTFESVTQGMGQAVANALIFGQNLGEALRNLLKQAAANIIAMLIQVGAQKLILSALSIGANKANASSEMATGLSQVFVNSFKSAAAIPVYGWAIAPQVASANLGLAIAGASAAGATGAGIGSGLAGAAHGGLTNVPAEQTFLLDKGERVLSPRQNEDLTEFISSPESGGGRGGVVIQNLMIEVLPNATSFDSLMSMSPAQIREVVAGKIIDALNLLDRQGIRPVFAERTGR